MNFSPFVTGLPVCNVNGFASPDSFRLYQINAWPALGLKYLSNLGK